ncbi:MAG: hypothetical protein ACTSWI_06630 [Alphaproteobacteria bacterium]
MAKGDDLWGDEPALGSRKTVDSQPTPVPANESVPNGATEDAVEVDAPVTEASSEPSALDYQADRIDRMSRTDLAKKQAFELTAIRMLLERLSARLDATDEKADEPDKGDSPS